MSAFYDLASLVLVPSGYKASKVYAQKPLTTDGQLTFSRASTATRVNSAGLIETVSSNVPRLDYQGSTCPKLLLEPQRTNSLTYSEQFDNGAWNKGTGGSISANSVVAPDGTTTADAYTFASSTSSFAYLSQFVAGTSQVANTFSIYMKRPAGSGSRTLRLAISNYLVSTASSSNFTVTESWQRFEFTHADAMTTNFVGVGLFFGSSGVSIAAGEVLHVWGAQLEAGAYPTSYVKTEAAAVTRLADAASKTGISSLIGQTEGTLFVEMNINKRVNLSGTGPNGLEIRDASGSNVITIGTGYSSSQSFLLGSRNAGSFSTLASTTNNALGTYKLAAAYSSAGFVFYINGVQIGTSATIPPSATFADMGLMQVFGTNNPQGELVNQALLFKTRLTNAQLAELTAL